MTFLAFVTLYAVLGVVAMEISTLVSLGAAVPAYFYVVTGVAALAGFFLGSDGPYYSRDYWQAACVAWAAGFIASGIMLATLGPHQAGCVAAAVGVWMLIHMLIVNRVICAKSLKVFRKGNSGVAHDWS